MMIMFISLYTFGINVHGDVLENVEHVTVWESYVLRAVFLFLMATHLPFIFFVGKDSLLSIIALMYVKDDITTEIIKNISYDEDYGKQTKQAYIQEKEKKRAKKRKARNQKKSRVHSSALLESRQESKNKMGFAINEEGSESSFTNRSSLNQEGSDYTAIIPTSEQDEDEQSSSSEDSYEDAGQDIEPGVDRLPNWIYYSVTIG